MTWGEAAIARFSTVNGITLARDCGVPRIDGGGEVENIDLERKLSERMGAASPVHPALMDAWTL